MPGWSCRPARAGERDQALVAGAQPRRERSALGIPADQGILWLRGRQLVDRGSGRLRRRCAGRPPLIAATRSQNKGLALSRKDAQRIGQAPRELHRWALHTCLKLAQHIARTSGPLSQRGLRQPQL
jgi:hypothetical protein